ncbi:acyltransferase [Rhodoferax sp. BAB1]|uniref:acyltransferase family protein n=1 Tax=Rhodoferax sp. BAB1 TaxID=2741720 RepID=UPI0015770FD7|nr:acyltransferase family protein [Rhodoferax sp. BAB1]QKO21344.1 acyltransferase [Rhodoferax sp. BAB1]
MLTRQTHIDALKCIGSQLIVLHHFSAYGPLADAAALAAPALMGWLYDYARMAVQIFLVLGGYLAMQGLQPAMRGDADDLGRAVLLRYLRLALPFGVAMLLAVAAAAMVRSWLNADFIPAAPGWGQALAHLFLLHDVVDAEALSAGVWYVAIDLQLYALLALLLWLGQRSARPAPALWLVAGLMLASLLHFNRDAGWDDWAPYFFGSYALGALAWWAARSPHALRWLGLLAGLGALALLLDWRTRIALALGVALLLIVLARRADAGNALPTAIARPLHALGRTSYALFLVHFPVLMLGNALYARTGGDQAGEAVAALVLSVLASVALAFVFERRIEAPLSRWISQRFSSKRRA